MALGHPPFSDVRTGRIALIGETQGQVRDVMIEGVSDCSRYHTPLGAAELVALAAAAAMAERRDRAGLLRRGPVKACAARNSAPLGPTNWRNGRTFRSAGTCCSSDCALATIPARSSPRRAPAAADQAPAGRAERRGQPGEDGRQPLQSGRRIRPHGHADLWRYAAGRQELDGEIVEESADALWTRAMIEARRERAAPSLTRIAVAIDRQPHPRRGPTAAGWSWRASMPRASASAGGRDLSCARRMNGRRRRSRCIAATRPMRWSSRSTRAGDGRKRHPRGRSRRARHFGQGDARPNIFGPSRWQRSMHRAVSGTRAPFRARGRDVRLRPIRPGHRPLAGQVDALVWALTHLMLAPKGRPRVRGM